jgi:hypothetical protein
MERVSGSYQDTGDRSRSASLKWYPMIVYITGQPVTIAAALHSALRRERPAVMNRTVRDFRTLAGIVINSVNHAIPEYILIGLIRVLIFL